MSPCASRWPQTHDHSVGLSRWTSPRDCSLLMRKPHMGTKVESFPVLVLLHFQARHRDSQSRSVNDRGMCFRVISRIRANTRKVHHHTHHLVGVPWMVVMMEKLLLALLLLGDKLLRSSFTWLWGPKCTHEQPDLLLLPGGRGVFFFTPTHLPLIKLRLNGLCLSRGHFFFFFVIHLPRGDTFF